MLGRGPIAFGPLAALGAYQAAGGILGITLGAVTSAGVGKVLAEATANVTLGTLTAVGTGAIPHTATLAVTLATITGAKTGKVLAEGSLAVTLGPATLAGAAEAIADGTLAASLAALGLAGSAAALIQGRLGGNAQEMDKWQPLAVQVPLADPRYSLEALELAGAGTVRNQVYAGTLATTLGPATLAGSADLVAKGTLAAGLAPLTLAGSADLVAEGTLAAGLGPLTFAASGVTPKRGTLAATLGALTLSSSADVPVRGAAPITLGGLLLAAAGTVENQVFAGGLDATLGPATLAGSAKAIVQGRLGGNAQEMDKWQPIAVQVPLADPRYTLEALELVGAGTVRNQTFAGGLDATLGPATLAGLAKALIEGRLSGDTMSEWLPLASAAPLYQPYKLAPLGFAAAGKVLARGTLATTLGALTLAGIAKAPSQGALATTLGALTLAGQARTPRNATLATTLAPLVLAGDGTAENQVFAGSLAATLGALTLAGSAKAIVSGHLGHPVIGLWTPLATAIPLAGPYELQPLGLAAAGNVRTPGFAGLIATLAPLTLAGSAKGGSIGWLTGGPVKMAGWTPLAGAVPLAVRGPVPYALAPLFGTMAATVQSGARLGDTLFPLMLVSTGTVKKQVFAGAANVALSPLTLAGSGALSLPLRTATLTAALAPLRLEGRGRLIATALAWPHEWCPAPGAGRVVTLAVDTVLFGDGYTWRSTRGLNPPRPALQYDFPFVGIDRLTQMDAFLTAFGAKGFLFTPPDMSVPIRVCCEEWTATIVDRNRGGVVAGSLRVTFQQAFNPQQIQQRAA